MSAELARPTYRSEAPAQLMAFRNPWAALLQDAQGDRKKIPSIGRANIYVGQDCGIYNEGDEAEVFFKVVSGIVRTCKFLADGRRQIDAFLVPGDVFGLEAGTEYTLSAEAVCGCTLISYRRRGLETFAGNSEELSHQLFSYAMRTVARARSHSLLLGRGSAIEKVAAFLTEWVDKETDGGLITLAMTRDDIADYLGLTVETVSRTLSALARDNVIALTTSRRILLRNANALDEMSACN